MKKSSKLKTSSEQQTQESLWTRFKRSAALSQAKSSREERQPLTPQKPEKNPTIVPTDDVFVDMHAAMKAGVGLESLIEYKKDLYPLDPEDIYVDSPRNSFILETIRRLHNDPNYVIPII